MSLIPSDISAYYSKNDNDFLLQGDIISAENIGLKEGEDSPDYWLIITKSCDLAFRDPNNKKVKNSICTYLGIYSIKKHYELIKAKYFIKPKIDYLSRIVFAGILNFSQSSRSVSKPEHLNNLIDDKIAKLMFLPPDGLIFTEPMIVDFELIQPVYSENVESILQGKKLQLSSPFRERLAQRFALHYSSIGIDDNEVKNPSYRESLKKHFAEIKKK